MASIPFLDNYEPLDVIGNGSFGIIRKVRRKSDGLVRQQLAVLIRTFIEGFETDFCAQRVEF